MRPTGITTFQSLSNPVFRLYIIGMSGQWASMNMGTLVRSWIVYQISGSGTALGLTALANAVPGILLSLWGGAIADRVQKKNILLLAMLSSTLVSLAVALSLTLGYVSEAKPDSWWVLVAAAGAQGTIMGLMMPARQTIIAEIVEPERLMNAISLNLAGMSTFRLLAPAAAGFLVAYLGYDEVYYIMTALYLVGAVCMFYMPKTAVKMSQSRSAWSDIKQGFSYLRQEKTMLYVVLFTLAGMICGMPFMQLMPMIIVDVLHMDASGQGILMSVSGVGAITFSLILASVPNRRRGFIMLATGGMMAVALIIFGFSSWYWLSIIAVAFVGGGQTGYRAAGNALVQHYTEPDYRGRVMSFMMMGLGFSGLGTFFAGVMAEHLGIQWSIAGLAAIFALATVVAFGSRRLRTLD